MKNIFFDMDGVLAEYRLNSTESDMKKKNYFLSLNPQQNVVNAFKFLVENSKQLGVNVFVLTKVYPNIFTFSKNEKIIWKEKYLPFLSDDNFVMVNGEKEEKSEAIKNTLGIEIDDNCVLVDDYNFNLKDWAKEGGTSIKLVNNINDENKSFVGFRLNYDEPFIQIASSLINHLDIDVSKFKNIVA